MKNAVRLIMIALLATGAVACKKKETTRPETQTDRDVPTQTQT